MGLYISFDLFHKDQTQPYVSEDGREIICEDEVEDEISIEYGYLWKNYVARDVLVEFIPAESGHLVIVSKENLTKVVEALSTRNWDVHQAEDAAKAHAELSKILNTVDFEREYLVMHVSD